MHFPRVLPQHPDALPEAEGLVEIAALARQRLSQGGVAAAEVEVSGPISPVPAVPCSVELSDAQRGQVEQRPAGEEAIAPVGQLPGPKALAALNDFVEVEVVLNGDGLVGERDSAHGKLLF